jgi:competence protein ComEC
MAKSNHIFIWKKAPFVRLLLPLIAGFIFQFYFKFQFNLIAIGAIILLLAFIAFSFLPEVFRFRFRMMQGMIISLFLITFGALITWKKDVRNDSDWYDKIKSSENFLVATINEPPVEKAKTYKALVTIKSVMNKGFQQNVKGKALIYFAKDSSSGKLQYGDEIIFKKPLQDIKNSGNPGAFDYAQYCAFQQIYQQVFLKKNEWVLLKEKDASFVNSIIFKTRDYILRTIENYIPGNDESSLAKALLIGYRVDLDKDLVQAYSNVGVVHLIAISGMHLALIYFFLVWLFRRIPMIKKSKVATLVLILFCLWFFALLTGAPASVLRSAVMFSFIAIGDSFNKRNSIYNSLAVSAFVLLCFDPFMLWDVGFQLSYLAVLGIVIFQKYIYNWFYFKNKILNEGWKLASVSIAAQLLTLPICIYYFHQFPLLFLLSNMVAIPLSTVALWGCIAVVSISFIPAAALYLGKLVWCSIWLLNHSVLVINSIPFSLWNGLSISIVNTLLLYFIFLAFSISFIKKNKTALKLTLAATLIFVLTTAYSKWENFNQRKVIVYNISQHQAIDFIKGNEYHFVGDSVLDENNLLVNYHINPARTALQLHRHSDLAKLFYGRNNFYRFYNTQFLIADPSVRYDSLPAKINVDYIIISKNPKLKIADISKNFDCNHYVFDASNSPWKIEQWKKECEELHLHFHSVAEQGAFVINF